MSPRRAPTLRARLLGQHLRQLREDAQLTLKDIAEYIQRDASTVSRFEAGVLPARVPEVLAYLDLCGIDDPKRREALKRLSQDAFQKGWWDGYADEVAGSLVDRIWLESRARRIQTFQPIVIPGLLQTRDYAQTVIQAADPEATPDEVTRWVEVRMARQHLLDQAEPVHLTAIIDEAALRRRVGGSELMRAQLDHLVTRGRRPNIDLLVLAARAGAHASPDGAFETLQMPEPYPDFGLIHTPAGEICVEAATVERILTMYDRLRDMAIAGEEALTFIEGIAEEMR